VSRIPKEKIGTFQKEGNNINVPRKWKKQLCIFKPWVEKWKYDARS
jgi:hypothetical protein